MIETITTYNPDASLAVWNFLRMVNPGYTLEVKFVPGGETDEEGQEMLRRRTDDNFGVYGSDYGGGLSSLVDVQTFTLITQGSVAGEIEVSQDLNDVLDWSPVDPRYIDFKKGEDGHFNPIANVGGQFIPLPDEMFRFIPLDSNINNPFGRGPLLPVLETVFFQTEVLRDLKAVAHTQGHPRLHIALLEEIVERHVPQHLTMPGNEENLQTWMNAFLSDVADQYTQLQPDDAFITYDMVKVEGFSAGKGSFDVEKLVNVVEDQVIASVKQLPAMLGRMDGSGLAHGTVQWQIFALGINSLRKKLEAIVSWWGTQTLRVWGRPSVAVLTFPHIRMQDRVKEAQAEQLETDTRIKWWAMGWASTDELAEHLTGHKAVEPFPLILPNGGEVAAVGEMEEGAAGEESAAESRQVFGIPSQPEALFFDDLPSWMRSRIDALRQSVNVQATLKRRESFDELTDEAGRDNGKVTER